MRVALVQLSSTDDVECNLAAARAGIDEGVAAGAAFVALPEAFAFLRREGARIPEPGALATRVAGWLSEVARERGVWLLGGSIPEPSRDGRLHNTTLVLAPDGRVAGRYRKIHLFDVDLDGSGRFRESDVYAPGRDPIVVATPFGGVGLSICYDLRFPELYRRLVDAGARWLCVPSAFTRETGAAHWEVLLRARAIESQCFVLAPAQCGHHGPDRASFGHSLVVDPWGGVLARAGDEPTVLVADCDPAAIERARRAVPSLRNRRL
ncbi:MAG: carbon-nitrogen hydrolase family protein [Myxococcales bacterium]|nr:carbon-nitrogen hydrolase family protein [Myxococcales bacterium]